MGDGRKSEGRLDAFVDAAFAFAVTLLVIGGGNVPESYADLERALASAPAFAVGFAILAMFWHSHVRWRGLSASPSPWSVPISVLLVFLVLVYVYPLRLMAQSLIGYASGGTRTVGISEFGSLFASYGLGFMRMSASMGVLFATSLPRSTGTDRAVIRGELGIWTILTGFGLVSAVLALVAPRLSQWVYALLPPAIGLFVWLHDWGGPVSAEPPPA